MNSEKVCTVSFGSDSLKLSILFDMKSEKVFTIVDSNCLKVNTFLSFWSNILLLYALKVFMHLSFEIKKQFQTILSIFDFLEVFLVT